jgi:hypothetical protein
MVWTTRIVSGAVSKTDGAFGHRVRFSDKPPNKINGMGLHRSKLECFIENTLKRKYKKLDIRYNDTETINSELDIYIPSLKLAFELNGIFHYEPIYGEEKLASVKNNDNRKFQACLEKNIELCIIDTTSQKCFSQKSSKKFVDIIEKIIDDKNTGA